MSEARLAEEPRAKVEPSPGPVEGPPKTEAASDVSEDGSSRRAIEAEEIAKLKLVAGTALSPAAATAPVAFQHSKNPADIPASLENAQIAFKQLRLDCRYDLFHDKIIVDGFATAN
jgi:hypothetical protein